MHTNNETNSASTYFNAHWQRYQNTIKSNTLYHREMLLTLQQFLSEHMGNHGFSFVDVGCGDSSTVAPILADTSIAHYIGIDAAKDVLKMAASSLANVQCEKEFITDDMITAVSHLSKPVDIIYTSYAVHHLTSQDKAHFIEQCQQKLKPHGFLLMVDGVLNSNQTRNEWLDALENRMANTITDITAEELAMRMEHPHRDDFPDSIETFSTIAKQQSWRSFQVLADKGIFAFMVFAK